MNKPAGGIKEDQKKKRLNIDGSDVLAVLGLGILAAGLYLINLKIMLVAVGIILLLIGFIGAWRKAK